MKNFHEYVKHLSRNKSDNTVMNYSKHITRFHKWLDVSPDPFELDQEVYLDYIDDLKSNYAPSTVHAHMTAIYNYLNFLLRKGVITKLPFFDSKELNEFLPVIEKKKPKSLSQLDVKQIIDSTDTMIEESIVRVLYDGALRVSELINLKWSDIEPDGTVSIRGKGKGGMTKLRYVHITDSTMNAIRKMKLSLGLDSEYVFVSNRTKRPFSSRRIEQIVEKLAGESGYNFVTTHTFRGSQATHLIENGMPIEYVSEYLGHEDINTTRNGYLDLTRNMHAQLNSYRNLV